MKMRGAVFLLYAEISSVMTLIASCVTNTLTANSETVDVTDKSVLFRELLENAGISSVSVKAQGVCNNSASFAFLRQTIISGTLFNARIESNTGEVYTGLFALTSFESSGEYNKGELFAITLESAGTTAFVDNDFRLLETGGIRLLEDGSYRILEAA